MADNCRRTPTHEGQCPSMCKVRSLFVTASHFVDLTRFKKIVIQSYKQVGKKAIGLSRVQQICYLCIASPYQISVSFILKHIHTASINTIVLLFHYLNLLSITLFMSSVVEC